MGTRSTVKFYSTFDDREPILCVYQQYDGYITGVGHELANFLKEKKIINGISGETIASGYANGMGCLAAQYVASQKTEIGGFYLTTKDDLQEYNYHVRFVDGNINIEVDEFNGTPSELLKYKEQSS